MNSMSTPVFWTLEKSLKTLFKITSSRLKYENRQVSKGQPVHALYRQETMDLARTHDFLEDHIQQHKTFRKEYEQLINAQPQLHGAQAGFFKCLDIMNAQGLLPPTIYGPAAALINNAQNAITRIAAQRQRLITPDVIDPCHGKI